VSKIIYAGYGRANECIDVTDVVRNHVREHNIHEFWAAGQLSEIDPSPFNVKYLFIIWKDDNNVLHSAVQGEEESKAIVVGEINDFSPVKFD
jgi:hypothetical protein